MLSSCRCCTLAMVCWVRSRNSWHSAAASASFSCFSSLQGAQDGGQVSGRVHMRPGSDR